MPRLPTLALLCTPALMIPALTIAPALAQDTVVPNSKDTIDQLRACRGMADPDARLACYDREVGAVIAATDDGSLQVVDRADVEETKRSLFGFVMPKIKLFGDGDEEMTTLETTITGVRAVGRETWVFQTKEGSVWRIAESKMGWRPPREGQPVEFKKAAMGSYFIRVNGQIGVKGRRIE
ncbi:MAG: hypothetical protein HKO08_04935 [Erythrobacter sp.]|nr:hypothetical protein [Erythrobacter sp.]